MTARELESIEYKSKEFRNHLVMMRGALLET
jgi:hypothetical protein